MEKFATEHPIKLMKFKGYLSFLIQETRTKLDGMSELERKTSAELEDFHRYLELDKILSLHGNLLEIKDDVRQTLLQVLANWRVDICLECGSRGLDFEEFKQLNFMIREAIDL
jgi:hypothetical protein